MIDPQPREAGGRWRMPVFTGAVAVLAVVAALLMFSAFMLYDDEGYVLISYRNFIQHGGLYRDVYSQYGPFPFVLHHALHLLGLPITHVAGRLVTLAGWTLTAVCCAAMVHGATRSLRLAVAVLALVFPYLWVMVSEPSHPGGLITVSLAVAALLGFRSIAHGRPQVWGAVTGAVGTALVLTKINVGGFVLLAGLAWILLHHESAAIRRWAPRLLVAGAVLLPLALMRPLLDAGWVRTYALVFAGAAVAATLAAGREGPARLAGGKTVMVWIASGIATAAVVLGVVFLRGTTPSELIDGILLAPLRHPNAFHASFSWPPGAGILAVVSLVACLTALWLRRRGVNEVDTLVALGRLVAAAGAVGAVLCFPDIRPEKMLMGYSAPCLWLFLWPLPGEEGPARAARTWLGLLWLGQFLHAFPVAGSQIAWGTFLALPLAAMGAHEATVWLGRRHLSSSREPLRRARGALRLVAAVVAVAGTGRFIQASVRYREGSSLGLPGAEAVRIPSQFASLLQVLTANASAHADVLFSEPGMFSLNLWSGVPTPTLANATHWFSLLDRPRQQAIIRALEAHPRACVVIQKWHLAYLTDRGFAPAGELHDYIARNFSPAFTLDQMEFRVRHGRTIEPMLLGEMLLLSDATGQPNTALRIRLPLAADRAVSRFDLTSPQETGAPALSFDASNARLEVTPTDSAGRPTGPPRAASWPLRFDGPAIVQIHFDRNRQPRPTAGALITLRAEDGGEVALARLRE